MQRIAFAEWKRGGLVAVIPGEGRSGSDSRRRTYCWGQLMLTPYALFEAEAVGGRGMKRRQGWNGGREGAGWLTRCSGAGLAAGNFGRWVRE